MDEKLKNSISEIIKLYDKSDAILALNRLRDSAMHSAALTKRDGKYIAQTFMFFENITEEFRGEGTTPFEAYTKLTEAIRLFMYGDTVLAYEAASIQQNSTAMTTN